MQVSTSQIAELAYELWEKEGRQHGKDQEYWLQAEALLKRKQTASAEKQTSQKASPTLGTRAPGARAASARSTTASSSTGGGAKEAAMVNPSSNKPTRNGRARK